MAKYKVTFKVEIDISTPEVDSIRKENRSFLTHGFFAKDGNIAKIAAYNKAVERIIKGDVIDYDIVLSNKTKL